MLVATDGAEDRPPDAIDDDVIDAIEVAVVRSAAPETAQISRRRVAPEVRFTIGYGLPAGVVDRALGDLDRTSDLAAIIDARMPAKHRHTDRRCGLLVAVVEPGAIRLATRGEHIVAIISDAQRAPRALSPLDRTSTRSISAGLVAGSTVTLSAAERPIPPSMLAQRHLSTSELAESLASTFGSGDDHAVAVARCLRDGG